MTTSHGTWSVEINRGVAVLTFSRPPRNFMSMANMEALRSLLRDVAADEDVRVVLLTSSTPGYFVAHGDLHDLLAISRGDPPSGDPRVWDDTLRLIEQFAKPVVAAVDGQAWGGGLELTLACSLTIASERAHFAFPEIDLGIIPGAGGTVRAPRRIGVAAAAEMILTGRVIASNEAKAMGLVQVVLPGDDFDAAARAWAQRVAAKPSGSLLAAIEALRPALGQADRDALRHEARLFVGLQRGEAAATLQARALERYSCESPDVITDLST